ncbi:MAG: Lrp/AsnC family transcriptional regulator [Alphaproteobacteria bacterium]
MKKDKYKLLQPGKTVALDPSDRVILRTLQHDNRVTNLELAEKAHLSPPTCMRRVQRLRKEGVIVGDVALVDPFKIGRSLIVIVEIVVASVRASALLTFQAKIMSEPSVLQCYAIAGNTDYLLIVCVEDMAAYLEFTRRMFILDARVRHYRSIFVLDRTKYTSEIPID